MESMPSPMLVIVCCHAIFLGTVIDDPLLESLWDLKSFQRSNGPKYTEHVFFIEHINAALDLLRKSGDSDALVVFSGGKTSLDHPDISEAQGYLNAAKYLVTEESKPGVGDSKMLSNIAVEEYATDTYQNILFSICKFYEVKKCYPASITVVTHAFKTERIRLHMDAIRWTRPFCVQGINPNFGGM